jgi:hypothetical protein
MEFTANLASLARDHAFLSGCARLWNYSVWNHHFIRMASPHAISVRGRRDWEAAGRTIKPGEKGHRHSAPLRHGLGSGFPFIVVEVFDVSQTEGTRVTRPADLVGVAAALPLLKRAPGVLGIGLERVDQIDSPPVYKVVARSLGGRIQVARGSCSWRTQTTSPANSRTRCPPACGSAGSMAAKCLARSSRWRPTAFVVS